MGLLHIVVAALLAAGGLGSLPAASGTFTPGGGPAVNFVGSDIRFMDVQANQTLTCAQVNFAGTVIDPGSSRALGENAGTLDDLSTSNCTNPLGGLTNVTLLGTPTVSITGQPAGTQWPAELADVSAQITVAGCSFIVEGDVTGVFETATQTVTPTANSLTIIGDPVGYLCPIPGIAKGQTFTVSGSWTNVPPVGSVPLALASP